MGRNIQKDYGQKPQITLFMPLLEGLDGVDKMSKSLGNYIGVNEDANTMYEKCMKIPDGLILKYYNLCTDLHPDEIEKISKRLQEGENPRNIKMELAHEITTLYHSEELADSAQEHFVTAFTKQEVPEDAPEIIIENKEDIANELLNKIMETGKYSSKGNLKRLFEQGAVKLDGEKVINYREINLNDGAVLQIGKGNYYKIICK